uniref:CCA tRNA nucleotidyltransferase 1, mitochondrial-like n=1 Tax=Dermatophagoides pteronyssinus TaxID=6956 RepID=A0A6P6Y3P9_DERPT|nr:CCA tRNA nucleotidyltransferase 1, mitochondrial-like [Dermatophagoides pteronyssinus]
MQLFCLINNFRRLNSRLIAIRNLYNNNSKSTQIETAKMSKLKCTHLRDLNQETFNLFERLIKTDEIQYLNEIFHSNGFEIRMAGGAVRDILCHIVPNDIDFASDAKPDEMINILSNKPDIRLITTQSGTKHGTVTARIRDKSQYEITTLRIDRNTDGRHAEVEFINDWKLDASRRDLTINSMFIDMNAMLYDYFDGEQDLKNKSIRFVGDPDKRIKEDYLRIFRYFRFHTRFGTDGLHDRNVIEIMRNNIEGLKTISGERIWSEMKRILINVNCTDSIRMMFTDLKIGKYLGFINDIDLTEFFKIQQNLIRTTMIWKVSTLFASLICDLDELSSITLRLKLSNIERDTIAYIISNRFASNDESGDDNDRKQNLKIQLAIAPKPNQKNLKDFIQQFLIYKGYDDEFIEELQQWPIPIFPFNGTMIFDKIQNKKELKIILEQIRLKWARQNFSMSQEQFYNEVDNIINQIRNNHDCK